MATDRIRVKVAGNSEIKVSEAQTIVKKIVIGTPIRNVVQADAVFNLRDSGSGIKILDGPIIPNNNLIDLGSPSQKFRSLYLSAGTLFVGNLSRSESDGELLLGTVNADGTINSRSQRSIATIDSAEIISTVN